MQSHRLLVLLVVLFTLSVVPVPAPAEGPRPTAPAVVRVPAAHRAAVDEVLGVLGELGLPMPAEVDVHVYETRAQFHRGLSEQAYVSPDRVEEIAAFAAGLARPGRVLLHAKAAKGRREWRRLIAHELAHVSQFALAGGDGRADQWLAEGVAERMAFEMLERLASTRWPSAGRARSSPRASTRGTRRGGWTWSRSARRGSSRCGTSATARSRPTSSRS